MSAQARARQEALRIFRLVLVVQIGFLGLSLLAVVQLESPMRMGLFWRAIPTIILVLLFLPPWLEPVLGRYFLAVGLGLQVFFASLESMYRLMDLPLTRLAEMGMPPEILEQLFEPPVMEPFFFLLIPLVLLAWGYGRKGAIFGAAWAAVLHLGIGLWLPPQSGSYLLFFIQSLARIFLLFLVPFIVSILAERERERHNQLETAYHRLRRHSATVEQLAVSRERIRLARELHDTLAHSLSALTVQLEALRTLLVNNPDAAQETLDDLVSLARKGLHDSRQAIQALRQDPVETMGLEGSMRDTLLAFQARTGTQANLSVAGQEPDLTAEETQALFRIGEEALINIERHASASQVNVRLASGSDRIDLVVSDDGRGFDPDDIGPERYGLTGMHERAAMVGATLDILSRPGGGTEIWCSLQK